jgi:tetratricopeptide (TPR) repeat protein
MALELSLLFPDLEHVVVRLHVDGDITDAAPQPFSSPLDATAQHDLHWYLEVYPAHYTTEVDDARAARLADQLPRWGEALFTAVFHSREAARLFNRFQDAAEAGRLLTISSGHPAVLAQPWELLRDPTGTYLFLERPRISVRRRLVGAGGGRPPFLGKAKRRLHLLFVVSRPTDAAFIDPRSDPAAVLDALAAQAPGRVAVEFLRPATFDHLLDRLEDTRLPPVDILHFDGHGVYDPDGQLADRVGRAMLSPGLAHLTRQAAGRGGPQGYLLFEDTDGTTALVSAVRLGEMLHRQQVRLVVLSACQSAMVGGDDPMGSVAARLLHAGLPAVLAMTHTVLVATTRALFGHLYGELARGQPIGTALDNARRKLYDDRQRGARQRGAERIALTLQDWFVPALYQAGRDTALLTKTRVAAPAPALWGNLPEMQESGFHGRSHALWAMERWFVAGTRRLVVHGFGGQGKTALAIEAGRWLYRTGLFTRVCFVSYANFQGVDPVGLAVRTLATVLGRTLRDAGAATAALAEVPTLLILDNCETLDRDPEPRRELLDAAVAWSEAGQSRVLLTTRHPDLAHPAYPSQESQRCRYLRLEGLEPEDALAWFQALAQLPPVPQVPLPAREALLALFAKVGWHPLSVGVLARELKGRRLAELGERLEALLHEADSPLMASLTLSLERLAPEAHPWLPRLGVFQGGAFEDALLTITEIPEMQWPPLRRGLAYTGLLHVESVPGVHPPFLQFDPTLALALWERLAPEAQVHLAARHRQVYYDLSCVLYTQDAQDVHVARTIAERELPNLLGAVSGAVAVGETWAADFAHHVTWFLDAFGRTRDRAQLIALAQAAAGEVGSRSWYRIRSDYGTQLYNAGRYREAVVVFQEILPHLGEDPSLEGCVTLARLGQCAFYQGQAAQAAALYRQALTVGGQLEPSRAVRRDLAVLQGDLAAALAAQGDYPGAQAAYEAALATAQELEDLRSTAIIRGQLGSLALQQGALAEAERRFREAIEAFQGFHEPANEAVGWHQLGVVYQEAKRWDDAEQAYREAARLQESLGDQLGAAGTWHQLGRVLHDAGKLQEVEAWYRKALEGFRAASNRFDESSALINLADLLQHQPERLAEAHELAAAALAIKNTLDPAAAEIWKTYAILAAITDREGQASEARAFRRKAREAWAGFKGARHVLRQAGPLIAAVVAAVANPERHPALESALEEESERGRGLLVAALRRVLDGERDADGLCEPLEYQEAHIMHTILQGIEEPGTLRELLEAAPEGEAPLSAPGGTS